MKNIRFILSLLVLRVVRPSLNVLAEDVTSEEELPIIEISIVIASGWILIHPSPTLPVPTGHESAGS